MSHKLEFSHLLSLEKIFLQNVWNETWAELFVVKMFSISFGHQRKGNFTGTLNVPNPIDHFFASVILFSILKQHMLTEEKNFYSEI